MQTGVEQIDDTTVKLTVTVEAERVSKAIDQAARELSAGMRVPGFRPGRVPRKVLESRIGKVALVEEAVRDAVPTFYAEAVQAEGLPVVGPPSIDVSTFEDGKDAEFTATVEVRPKIDVPDYSCIQIAHPDWDVTDEEIDRELDAMRDRFAELETVKRPADYGDSVVVTITGKRGEEIIEQASGQDLLYPLGSAGPDAVLDKALLGQEAGAIVRFNDTLGDGYPEDLRGQELSFTAIVKEVKRKNLPELDDDFAVTASEFDTIEELRDELAEQLSEQRRQHAAAELRQKVMQAVVGLVEVSLPDSMVEEELRFSLGRLQRQAAAGGMSEEDLAAAMAEDVVEGLTEQARETVKAQLVLDAVGRDAGIMVVNEDIAAEVARQATRLGQPPEKLAEFMLHPDRVGVLYTDAFRRKSIDHLVASVEVLGGPPPEEPEEPEVAEDEQHPDPRP